MNKQQRELPLVTTKLPLVTTKMNKIITDAPMSNNDIDKTLLDTRKITASDNVIIPGIHPTTCTLPPLAYKNLSPEGAAIWQ